MKFMPGDFEKLRSGLVLFIALLSLGAGTLTLSIRTFTTARQDLASAQAQHGLLDAQAQRTQTAARTMDEDARRFQQILERGMLGKERRLEWIEHLKALADKHRMADLHYELAPRQSLSAEADGVRFFASPMSLRIEFLHENELLDFLDALRLQPKALVLLRSCHLFRLAAAPSAASSVDSSAATEETAPRATLRAECRIDWVTLEPAQEKRPSATETP